MTEPIYCAISAQRVSSDGETRLLISNSGGGTVSAPSFMQVNVDYDAVSEKVEEYWSTIGGFLRDNHIRDEEDDTYRHFVDDMVADGIALAEALFPSDEDRHRFAALIEEADVLVVFTDCPRIPWENLILSSHAPQSRIGETCVVTRIEINNGFLPPNQSNDVKECTEPVIIFDQEISAAHGESIDGALGDLGYTIHNPSVPSDVKNISCGKDIIVWLCEHEVGNGLRLQNDKHYERKHIGPFGFQKDDVLFLISCETSLELDDGSFATDFVNKGGCTVVCSNAPVQVRNGVEFTKTILKYLASVDENVPLWRAWGQLTSDSAGPNGGVEPWKKVVQLTFCLYGGVGQIIGAQNERA